MLVAIMFAASPARGTALPLAPAAGLDLVVLVDRSGSMLPEVSTAARSPQDLRGSVLGAALDLIARSAQSSGAGHRFGVVSFGSTVEIDLPLTAVAGDDAERLRHALEAQPPRRNLGDTDALAAFAAAARMLDAAAAETPRKRAVLLVTDGIPDVPGTEITGYQRRLRRFVAERFPPPQTTVDVLLLTSPGHRKDRPDVELWRQLSQGRVHHVADDRYVALATVQAVVADLIGARTAVARPSASGDATMDTLMLPPYLEIVVLDVLHGPDATQVRVFAPDSIRPLTSASEGVEEIRLGNTLTTIVVRRPPPGLWRFRKSRRDGRVRVLSQQFFTRGVLLRPAADSALRQHDDVALAYRLLDGHGYPLRELPDYPLSIHASLVKPDGARLRLHLSARPQLGAAVFATATAIACDRAGRYWIELRVNTRDLDRQLVQVYRDNWSGFSVAAATRIHCRVTTRPPLQPAFGIGAFIRGQTTVATRVECSDPQAQPVEMTHVVKGAPASVFAPALLRDGRPTAAALTLDYHGRGAFEGWLSGAGSPGDYRLQVGIDRARLASGYNVRFSPASTLFVRRRGSVPLLVAVAGVAALTVLAWLGAAAGRRHAVAHRVTLKARDESEGHDVIR